MDSSLVGYDGGQYVSDVGHTVVRKKPGRKADPTKRGIAWPRWTGFQGKTLWDILQLLIVPLVLVFIGYAFSVQQDARQQAIEEQRAQDLALQGYLDQMGTLMLEDLSNEKVRSVLRARTLTVLQRPEFSRKQEVMNFLVEADLLRSIDERAPVIELAGGMDLALINLERANLEGANLERANLYLADLSVANLEGANLIQANLESASLSRTNLRGANLYSANLEGADLSRADLSYAQLSFANLEGADLSRANLIQADLVATNLQDASGITNDELAQQVDLLGGATMPNGQKYEDWLKSKGSGEDGEGSGPQ